MFLLMWKWTLTWCLLILFNSCRPFSKWKGIYCLTISHLEYLRDDVLSWQFSCVLPWIFSSLCCHVVFGTGRYRRVVLASEKENVLIFVYCPSMWYHLFPGQAECVWKLLCCSLWLCYGRRIPRARRHSRNDHMPDSRPVCCVKSGDSSGLWRWDVLYW